jgi:hypothetical protein
VGGKKVELETLLFEICVMVGNSDVVNADGSATELKLLQLPGPPDPAMAAAQFAWLEERMGSSTADYLWETPPPPLRDYDPAQELLLGPQIYLRLYIHLGNISSMEWA